MKAGRPGTVPSGLLRARTEGLTTLRSPLDDRPQLKSEFWNSLNQKTRAGKPWIPSETVVDTRLMAITDQVSRQEARSRTSRKASLNLKKVAAST